MQKLDKINLNHWGVFADTSAAHTKLADLWEESTVFEAGATAFFAPADGNDWVESILCVEVVDLQGVLDDVAAAKHRDDRLGFVETDIAGIEGEATAADAQVKQEVPGTFSAPGAEVDLFGDGTVEVVVAVARSRLLLRKAVSVNLLLVKELASAVAVLGQQVLEDLGEEVAVDDTLGAVDAELIKAAEFKTAADVETHQ